MPPADLTRRPADGLLVPVAPTATGYRLAKRTLDVLGASVGLAVVSPVLGAVAISVKLDSPGPVLFRQIRLGRGGRPFTVLKFRTMHLSADERRHQEHIRDLLRTGEAATEDTTWAPIAADPRVTRVGGFLRRSHLDELPQFVNVLRGDMSLVGPRPPIPYEVELYEPWQLRRLTVVPGLTGLWQAYGWGRLTFAEGVKLDLEYVERRSFGLDVRIILRTLWQILVGRQF
ncbi:MAG: sugar transferase [Chloroflexi bacterium]|nr:MAG: sugar transferase [Chloroflexota bacterium]